MKMLRCLCLAVFLVGISTGVLLGLTIANVPRMDKEDLRKLLDNPDVIILDVRIQSEWEQSAFKIKGAVRLESVDEVAGVTYPKDKTLVLYCA
jgi:predicted sulfurtransferase